MTDPVPFLANIALVAHADGKLSPAELGHLEAIRAELKITKGNFSKAMALASSGDFKLTPVGSFADQVHNLELMLRVAYADDDLEDAEASLIAGFCHLIGVTQDQIDRIEAEVLATLKQPGIICTSCGAGSEPSAKFCPACGAAFVARDQASNDEFQLPRTGIAIAFADSTSASFARALTLATSLSGYQKCQKNKKTWHLAPFPSGSFAEALPLAETLGGIRNKIAYQDGVEKSWDEVFGFAWCASKRAVAYRPAEYCFGKDENRLNPWGCKQARMDWTDWSDWFSYGVWEKTGLLGGKVVWRFDKERIRHELATRLHVYRYCPHLATGLSESVLRQIPDTVDPAKDKNWSFNRSYNEAPGCLKVVEKEGNRDYTVTDEYWSDGVRPVGLNFLREILQKAIPIAGNCGITAGNLLQ